MKIAVITPVFQTPRAWLEQCLASVREQTVPCTHFVIGDGDTSFETTGCEVIHIPGPHHDNGIAARAVGSVCAITSDFDALAYLDADNWFEADHLEQMALLHERSTASVCTAARNLVDLEGCLLGQCPEVDGERFADTSCFFLTRAAFGLVQAWYLMPRSISPICDRVMWRAVLDGGHLHAHRDQPTVNFRTGYRAHYVQFGKPVPAGAKHVKVSPEGRFISAKTVVEDSGLTPSTSMSSSKAKVSLCMIVKNEENNLADCLGPVAGLFHEIIVVDTGSTDGTKECARRLGAKVFDFAWVDDFAAARNESLRHASGDWIFWLDGDDRLDGSNLHKLRQLLSELPDENNTYLMCQKSAPDRITGTTLIVDQVRLFRNLPAARWKYRVHEQIFLALKEQGAREVHADIVIDHLGYQEPELRQSKRERNLRLLKLELEENPADAFVLFNQANTAMDGGQLAEAIDFLRRCLKCAPAGASYLPKVYFMLAGGYQLLGQDKEAIRWCQDGKKHFPQAAVLWFQEGILLLARGELAGARQCFEAVLRMPSQCNYFGVDARLGCRARHNLAFVYHRLGLPDQAEKQWQLAISQTPEFEPAWLALLELLLERNRHADAEALLIRLERKPYREAIWPALAARLKLARGDVADAQRTLEDALERSPNAIWLRILLADILLCATSDSQRAEFHLRQILALAPNELQTRRKLACLLSK